MHRLLWLLLIVAATPLHAQTTHYADSAGDCDGLTPCHPTVMQAVNEAADGDRIEVFPGAYAESVTIAGRTGLSLVGRVDDSGAKLVCKVEPVPSRAEFTQTFTVDLHENLRIENLTLLSGVELRRVTNSTFERNSVAGDLYISMCYGVQVRHNRLAQLSFDAAGDCAVADNSFTGSGLLFTSMNNADDTVVSGNVFLAGDLRFEAERQRGNHLVNNRLYAGSMVLAAHFQFDDVVIEGNVLDAGRLHIETGSGARNRVTGNRVFDSDGDGIFMEVYSAFDNDIIGNTSRGHAGCDIRDVEQPGVDNNWSGNDYDTACGSADG